MAVTPEERIVQLLAEIAALHKVQTGQEVCRICREPATQRWVQFFCDVHAPIR